MKNLQILIFWVLLNSTKDIFINRFHLRSAILKYNIIIILKRNSAVLFSSSARGYKIAFIYSFSRKRKCLIYIVLNKLNLPGMYSITLRKCLIEKYSYTIFFFRMIQKNFRNAKQHFSVRIVTYIFYIHMKRNESILLIKILNF